MIPKARAIYCELTAIARDDEREIALNSRGWRRSSRDEFTATLYANGCADVLNATHMEVGLRTAQRLLTAAHAYRSLRQWDRMFVSHLNDTWEFEDRGLRLDAAIQRLKNCIAVLSSDEIGAMRPGDRAVAEQPAGHVLKGSRPLRNAETEMTAAQRELLHSYAKSGDCRHASFDLPWTPALEKRFVAYRLGEMTSPGLLKSVPRYETETLPALEAADFRARRILRLIAQLTRPPAVYELRAASEPPDWYVEFVDFADILVDIFWAVSDDAAVSLAQDEGQRSGMPGDRMVVAYVDTASATERLRDLGFSVTLDPDFPHSAVTARHQL